MEISFTDLIRPFTPGMFFDEYWERKPFVGDGCEQCTTLISLSDIEHLIASLSNTGRDWFRLVKESRPLPSTAYVREDGFVNLQRVYDAVECGHSILLPKLDRRWPPVRRLARAVEREFASFGVILSRHVGADLHLTPRNGVGLAPHFDVSHALVLQVAGEKCWRVYEPVGALPIEPQTGPLEGLGAPCLETTLRAGDVLCVPRGWPHQAVASVSGSIHITLDLYPSTWCDLLCAAVRDEPMARRAVSVGLGRRGATTSRSAATYETIVERIGSPAVLRGTAEALAGQFVESLGVLPGGGLKTVLEPQSVTEDTRLVRRDGAIPHVDSDADRVRLRFPGSALSAPKTAESLFEFLEQRSGFTVRELPEPLTPAEKIAVARQLVREQFLMVAE